MGRVTKLFQTASTVITEFRPEKLLILFRIIQLYISAVHRCTYCRRIVGDWFGHAIGSEYIRMKDFDFSSKEKSVCKHLN